MSGKRFSIMQMMLVMLVFCVVAAAIGQLVSGRSEVSPLIFMLMLMCSPADGHRQHCQGVLQTIVKRGTCQTCKRVLAEVSRDDSGCSDGCNNADQSELFNYSAFDADDEGRC